MFLLISSSVTSFIEEKISVPIEPISSIKIPNKSPPFFTKAVESCETGEKFTYKRQHTGKSFAFDPNGEEKEGIASMLEEAKGDLIKGRKLLNLLSAFKDTSDNVNN